jgi:hypothetical protein
MKTLTRLCRQFAVIALCSVMIVGVGVTTAPSAHAGPHFSHSHGRHHGYGHNPHRGYGYGLRFGHYHRRSHYGRHHSHRYGYGYSGHHYRYGRPRHYYRRSYGYYAPPYQSYDYGYRPTFEAGPQYYNTPIIAPSYSSEEARSSTDEHAINGQGWTLLVEGRPSDALRAFGRQATNNPAKGGPKVGYALAAASSGDLNRGIWAMRRALRIDPAALHYIMLDAALRPTVSELIARYASEAERSTSSREAAFMLASLYYLNGDADAARASLSTAIDGGDRSESSARLQTLIEER